MTTPIVVNIVTERNLESGSYEFADAFRHKYTAVEWCITQLKIQKQEIFSDNQELMDSLLIDITYDKQESEDSCVYVTLKHPTTNYHYFAFHVKPITAK